MLLGSGNRLPSADDLNNALAAIYDQPEIEGTWLRFSAQFSSPVLVQVAVGLKDKLMELGFADPATFDVLANGDELQVIAQIHGLPQLAILALALAAVVVVGLTLLAWQLEQLTSDPRAGALVWTTGAIVVAGVAALGLYWLMKQLAGSAKLGQQIYYIPYKKGQHP